MSTTEKIKHCPQCGAQTLRCPECSKVFYHGQASHCDEPACKAMNAPLDCQCGFVACDNLRGVLDLSMKLIPYKR